jgi:catechol 2,3-dioxygenase-like lactoylglutathione lyase family enzyme
VKLNHLDLQVSDVQRSVMFFESVFDMQLQSSRTSPALAIMSDGEGFTLVLQRRKHDDERYPEGFHLGFLVDDVDLVHRMRERAVAAGVECSDVIKNNRGTLLYCRAPDGYSVEVSCHRR